MSFSVKSYLKKILVNTFFHHLRRSYAQSGEDIIISDLFTRLNIPQPAYLDIGTNDPVALNNTYRLYTRGSKGVCIEPNPALYQKIKRKRKRDICLHCGVAFDEQQEADYYCFPEPYNGLNTFSKEEATFWETQGTDEIGKHRVEKVIRVPLVDINAVMEKYFSPHPNLVSIDVEGLDLRIIEKMDFSRFRPEVICTETLGFSHNHKEIKKKDVISYLTDKGYFVYADTYINTIFCRKESYPVFTT